jgi:hypothetical protein
MDTCKLSWNAKKKKKRQKKIKQRKKQKTETKMIPSNAAENKMQNLKDYSFKKYRELC